MGSPYPSEILGGIWDTSLCDHLNTISDAESCAAFLILLQIEDFNFFTWLKSTAEQPLFSGILIASIIMQI